MPDLLLRSAIRPALRSALRSPLEKGVGAAWAVGTPTIAVVEPVTNPPSFDIGLDITAPNAVAEGDVIKLRIDGGTTYSSSALTAGDIVAGTIELANGTLTAALHTADASVWRGGVQVSAWSSATSYTTPSTYSAEALAVFAAFTTPPDDTRKGLIDTFIAALKTSTVWTKLDALYVFAAADSQAALINWKNPGTFDATVVSSPTFTADRGFTGNGSSSYLDSGFTPSTAPTPNFVLNAGSIGGRSLSTGVASNTERLIGNNGAGAGRTVLYPRAVGDLMRLAVNDGIATGKACANRDGFFVGNRSGASATEYYRNGSSVGSDTTASAGLTSVSVLFLRDATNYATMQIASGVIGGSLSSGDVSSLYAAELVYMQAVGAA